MSVVEVPIVSWLTGGETLVIFLGGDRHDAVVGVIESTDGAVVSLRCTGRDAARRLAAGRAIELASLSHEPAISASVIAADACGPDTVLRASLGAVLPGNELRTWTRIAVEVPVCVSVFGADRLDNFVGTTRNLSVGGLLMHSFAPVPSAVVIAAVHLDGRQRLALLAEVLDTKRPVGERGWLTRLRFVAQDGPVLQVIKDFVVRALVEQRPARSPAACGSDQLAHFRNATRRIQL